MGAGPTKPVSEYQPGIQIVPTTTATFVNDWSSNDQRVIFEANSVGGDKESAFYDPITNKFYTKVTLSLNGGSFPRTTNIEFLFKDSGDFTVGHEQNASGTSFTTTTVTNIWFGGDNCRYAKQYVNCARGSVIVTKNPGTYTCSTGGLGVNDPARDTVKYCVVLLPIRFIRITNFPLNTNIVFSEEKNVY